MKNDLSICLPPVFLRTYRVFYNCDNFNLPINNNDKLTTKFIKNIENNFIKLLPATQVAIRNCSSNIINNLPNYSIFKGEFNTLLKQLTSTANKFLNNTLTLLSHVLIRETSLSLWTKMLTSEVLKNY